MSLIVFDADKRWSEIEYLNLEKYLKLVLLPQYTSYECIWVSYDMRKNPNGISDYLREKYFSDIFTLIESRCGNYWIWYIIKGEPEVIIDLLDKAYKLRDFL